MLLTATTILLFLFVAVASIGIGHFSGRVELYFLGVVIMLFMGLFIIQSGIAEQVGVNVTINTTENVTFNFTNIDTVQENVNVYDTDRDVFSGGLGLLLVVIAGGLSLTFFQSREREKKRKLGSLDLDE